jgi:AraC-like DNA-binding protein
MSVLEQGGLGDSWQRRQVVDARNRTEIGDRRQIDTGVVIAQTSGRRVDVLKSLKVASAQDDLVISHMSRSTTKHGMTEPQPRKAGYSICVHLEQFCSYDIWRDEKHYPGAALAPGTIHINDMRHSWRADIQGSFQVVNFYVPQSALDEITEDRCTPRVEALRCFMEHGQVDVVVWNVALALLPALMRPEQANRLFFDHAWRAVTAHLVNNYGLSDSPQRERGGLAPWQERRAKEMLLADLSGNVTLPDLALACRLSCSHFSQAFRQTVGCPPHQWLLAQRVERSKEMMLNTEQSLSEIALATGFADQSHFTRVFSRLVSTSPAAWRRAQER